MLSSLLLFALSFASPSAAALVQEKGKEVFGNLKNSEPVRRVMEMTKGKALTGAIAVIIGLVLCFLGTRLIVFFSAAVGAIAGVVLSFMTLSVFNREPRYDDACTWIVTSLVTIASVILCVYLWRVAVYLAGALGGLCLSFFLCPIIQQHFTTFHPQALQISFQLLLAAAGAVLTYFFEGLVLIVLTSFVGACVTVYGVDTYAQKGFATSINAAISGLNMSDFAYREQYPMLLAVAVLTVLGIVFQMMTRKDDRKKRVLN